jgi:hypothetical protein
MHSTDEPTESMSGARRTDGPSLWEPLAADGIGRIRYAKGDVVSEDLARTTIAELKALGGGKSIPVLVDIRQMKSVSREARAIFGGPHGAFALVAKETTSSGGPRRRDSIR